MLHYGIYIAHGNKKFDARNICMFPEKNIEYNTKSIMFYEDNTKYNNNFTSNLDNLQKPILVVKFLKKVELV